MRLTYLFLLPDEHPQQLMYICPVCNHQSFLVVISQIATLPCRNCGITLDGSQSELVVLSSERQRLARDLAEPLIQ